MANDDNLKPFQKGHDPRRGSKPLGSKHLSTYIREMLEDETFTQKLSDGTILKSAPVKAIVKTLIVKAAQGDLRAFNLLAKHGYGQRIDLSIEEGSVKRGMSIEEIDAILERARQQSEEKDRHSED